MSVPGWYPDPWQPTRWRYFDGVTWSGFVHPHDSAVPVLARPEQSSAQWWWASGTLLAVFIASVGLAWIVNR